MSVNDSALQEPARGKRLPLLGIALSAVAGIAFGVAQPLSPSLLIATGLVLLLVAASGYFKNQRSEWILYFGAFLSFSGLSSGRLEGGPAAKLAGEFPGPRVAIAEGWVSSAPRPAGTQFYFNLDVSELTLNGTSATLPFSLRVRWQGDPPEIGDRVRVRGTWQSLPSRRNPGTGDSRNWLARKGVYSELVAAGRVDCLILTEGEKYVVRRVAARVRAHLLQAFRLGGDERSARLVSAVALGDTSGLTLAEVELFRTTGTYHLFSVSGLHVGMVAAISWLFWGLLRLPRWLVILLTVLAVIAYTLITGAKPPSVRACIMAMAVLLGLLIDRPSFTLNSLLLAALVILAINPAELWNPGFQFSFFVVGSLILAAGWLTSRMTFVVGVDPFIPVKFRSFPQRVRAFCTRLAVPLIVASVIASSAAMILTAAYFHHFSPYSALVNVLSVPLAFLVLSTGFISAAGASLGVPLISVLANNANIALTGALYGIVSFAGSLPGAVIPVTAGMPAGGQARLTVLDLGRGSSMLLETAGGHLLIDTGPAYLLRSQLLPFLRHRGVTELSALVLTHGDVSHIGAAAELVNIIRPQKVILPKLQDRSPTRRKLLDHLEETAIPVIHVAAGDSIQAGSTAELEVLSPGPEPVGALADDRTLCLLFEIHDQQVLFLGDSGPGQWAELPSLDRISVVLQGAHSSGTAPRVEVLQTLQPRVAICTSVKFPRSEVLPEEAAKELRNVGVELFRQDLTGAVTVTFFSDRFTVTPFLPVPSKQTEFYPQR